MTTFLHPRYAKHANKAPANTRQQSYKFRLNRFVKSHLILNRYPSLS